MIQTVEGIFRNGKVELLQEPVNIREARVIVTFLPDTINPVEKPALTSEELAGAGETACIDEDEVRFKELVAQWCDETDLYSSVSQKINHPAYQQIISMDKKALPWILRELRDRPNLWFNALKTIAKETPVPFSERADSKKVREAWLNWGRERGLLE